MESAPNIEVVLQALNALYRNPDVAGKEKASVWLGELQKSVFAWEISDKLLQINQDVETCYFAANTMRSKIQYSFHELPADSRESLKTTILNHVTKITCDTPHSIATQLCLAVADLALQMANWKNAVEDLMQRFGGNPQYWHFLVEFLAVYPEEINSRSLRLGANRRNEITEELSKCSPVLIHLLSTIIDSGGGDESLQVKVFKCMGSWFSVYAIPQDVIINTKVLPAPFEALSRSDCSPNIHEAASDCICWALYSVEDLNKNMLLAQTLFQGVLSLLDPYHMSVAMEDVEKSVNLCRVFTEMAEAFIDVMVETPNAGFGDFRTLDLLLTCIGHSQYEVAAVTFNFWYRLSEILYSQNVQAMNDMFKPYIQRLVIALCRHCQFDADMEGIPSSGDDFVDFRAEVSELVKDVVFIVGSSAIFSQMFEELKHQTSTASWEISEASLFVMTAVARNILPDENEVVPQVFQAVLNLPSNAHVMVRYTSIQLIGELCEWIEKHPQLLDPVLQFLLNGLQQTDLATVASYSVLKICEQCRDKMIDHFSGLLHIIEAMDSFSLSQEACLGLLRGASLILAKMPHDKITPGLKQLCYVQIAPLNKILETADPPPQSEQPKTDPSKFLDRLATIFRDTVPTVTNGQLHPCQPVIQEIWPVLSNVCNKYQADVKIIERCCRCIRYAVRCLRKDAAVLLNPLVAQMVSLYQHHQHSCFLYLGSILVDEYGTEELCLQGLVEMLVAFCEPTFKILDQANGLVNHPDTLDDLFRLGLRFTQRAPVVFLKTSVIKPLICCAIAATNVDHREANASVTKFLSELARAGRTDEDEADFEERKHLVLQLFQEHGQPMCTALINACVFKLPSYMIPDSADVIYEMMLIDRPSVCRWLEQTLKALPTESKTGVVTATQKQLSDFHKVVTSAEETKPVSRAIRDFVKLYR